MRRVLVFCEWWKGCNFVLFYFPKKKKQPHIYRVRKLYFPLTVVYVYEIGTHPSSEEFTSFQNQFNLFKCESFVGSEAKVNPVSLISTLKSVECDSHWNKCQCYNQLVEGIFFSSKSMKQNKIELFPTKKKKKTGKKNSIVIYLSMIKAMKSDTFT